MMNKNECCDGCKYYRSLSNMGVYLKACHYCYDTGAPRGCPLEECDKREVKNEKDKDKEKCDKV